MESVLPVEVIMSEAPLSGPCSFTHALHTDTDTDLASCSPLTYASGLSSWQLDPQLANVLRMGWAEAHTQRPPFTTILEEVTAHHQQACNHLLYSALATGNVLHGACALYVHLHTERVHLDTTSLHLNGRAC